MSPITVVSSAICIMWLEKCVEVQSTYKGNKSSGLSTHPCGEPVLRVREEERWIPPTYYVRTPSISGQTSLWFGRVWPRSWPIRGAPNDHGPGSARYQGDDAGDDPAAGCSTVVNSTKDRSSLSSAGQDLASPAGNVEPSCLAARREVDRLPTGPYGQYHFRG